LGFLRVIIEPRIFGSWVVTEAVRGNGLKPMPERFGVSRRSLVKP
jgi:hypothetical protein